MRTKIAFLLMLALISWSGCFAQINFYEINATLDGVESGNVEWGDFDHDADIDALISGLSANGVIVKIYRNDGNDTFTDIGLILPGTGEKFHASYADYDNDNDLDIAVCIKYSASSYSTKIFRNDGVSTFTDIGVNLSGGANPTLSWGDYNNDNYPDIFISGDASYASYFARIYMNNGNSTFTEINAGFQGAMGVNSAGWADFDNDGDLDLFYGGWYFGYNVNRLYRNEGNNLFTNITTSIPQGGAPNAWCDFNNDNYPDLLPSGGQNVFKNNGNGTFSSTSITFNGLGLVNSGGDQECGDCNNDGFPEVLISGGNEVLAAFYKNNADETFTLLNNSIVPVKNSTAKFGDYNNDGLLDLIICGFDGSNKITKIYKNTSIGSCTTPIPVVQNATNCGTGTVTLTASGGTAYNWYNTATGGSVIGTGATFTTPFLTVSDTFWVTNVDTCESARVPAIVTILTVHIIQNDTTINAGSSVALSITGASTPLPTNGLVGNWPFNGNANDESGNGNNGAVYGATLTTDRFGIANNAYLFNGISNYIKASSNQLPTGERTTSFWLNASDYNHRMAMAYGGGANNGLSWLVHLNMTSCSGNNNITMQSHGCINALNAPISFIPVNQWNHVVITTSSAGTKIYLNGVMRASNLTYVNNTYVFGKDIAIGSAVTVSGIAPYSNSSDANYFNGKLDEVRIYNRALNQSEITALYNEGSTSTSYTYLWSTGEITPSISVTPTQTTTYYVTITNDNTYCTDSVTVTVSNPNPVVTGTLTYNNTQQTTLSCIKVYLKTIQGVIVDSTDTDISGHYEFFNIPDGNYSLTATTTKAWGGVNSTDALQALKHFVQMIQLEGLKHTAANVDMNPNINSIDALIIQKRFIMEINSFPVGDWAFENPNVTIIGPSTNTVNMKGICFGDVNGSYTPPDCTGIPCPGTPSFEYGGQTYNTVQIGTQCWMKENLNIGTMINGTSNQTDNSTIEKYCYNNDPANCAVYGGLYQWDEIMNYSTENGSQGICPIGWHIPNDTEFTTLTNLFGGFGAGGALKETGINHWSVPNEGATNESGFTALGAGFREGTGGFNTILIYTHFWTSTEGNNNDAWIKALRYDNQYVYSGVNGKEAGLSVRCVKD
jgi:uncharacterized protein (TIGR02145 family)